MLARIAQELFWLGRDLTRAEHTARMLDGAFHADVAGAPASAGSRSAGRACWRSSAPSRRRPGERGAGSAEQPRAAVGRDRGRAAADARHRQPGVGRVVRRPRARARARTLRDVISTEMWEALNSFYLCSAATTCRRRCGPGRTRSTRRSRSAARCSGGCVDRTMLRDEGRAFLEAGGRIEQADMVLRMLRVAIPPSSLLDADRPRDRGARAAARGRRLPGLPARGPRTRRRSARSSRFLLLRLGLPGLGRLVGRRAARRRWRPPTPSRARRRRCCGSGG